MWYRDVLWLWTCLVRGSVADSSSKVFLIILKKAETADSYDIAKKQLRIEKIQRFLGCSKFEDETVDNYFLERFKAELTDRFVVVAKVFFDALLGSVSRFITIAMSRALEVPSYDFDYVSAIAGRIDNAVDKKESKSVNDTTEENEKMTILKFAVIWFFM